jgi:hypothetical protein
MSLAIVGNRQLVTITDLTITAPALVSAVRDELELTRLDDCYSEWDFIRDEPGRTFEVLVWAQGSATSSDAAREHFAALGAQGNTALFLEWIRNRQRNGWFITVPEDDRLFRNAYGERLVPVFLRDGESRRLRLGNFTGEWQDTYMFVAFREVKP